MKDKNLWTQTAYILKFAAIDIFELRRDRMKGNNHAKKALKYMT